MLMTLAVTKTVPVPVPQPPAEMVNRGKDVLAPVAGSSLAWIAAFALVLLGLYFSSRTSRTVKLGSLAVMALLVIGWDSDRGILTAAMGSKQAADQALLTAVAIGAAWALLRGPRGGTVANAGGGRRGLLRFGRRH